MRPWLPRFANALIIVAVVLWWTAYRQTQAGPATSKVVVLVVAGALAAGLGIAGVRLRHSG